MPRPAKKVNLIRYKCRKLNSQNVTLIILHAPVNKARGTPEILKRLYSIGPKIRDLKTVLRTNEVKLLTYFNKIA
jgi:hypothetical protein